jgi:purine-cytosine permease-like protein
LRRSQYAGGWPGTFIFSILNIFVQLAYSITTAIAGAQALHAINTNVSLIVGIVVVSIVVLVIAAYGYNLIHYVERYAWVVMFAIYCLLYGLLNQGDPDVHRMTDEMDTGRAKVADLLSW